MIVKSKFKPYWMLANQHCQTIYPRYFEHQVISNFMMRELVNLSDGDFIELMWSEANLPAESPLVILLHGLGGNVHSHYVSNLFKFLNTNGFRCVLMHFRGTGQEPNRLLRSYHAGETQDFFNILKILEVREPKTQKMVVGISMGGSVLLKWLGEQGRQNLIHKAIAISVPFNLENAATTINQGFATIYQNYMLSAMRHLLLRKLDTVPSPYSKELLFKIKSFWEYDDLITSPIFGFKNAQHYYHSQSCRSYLSSIQTPTLIIHSEDDPFMTPEVIPKEFELSKDIILELSQYGGHVGFIGNQDGSDIDYWLKHRVLDFFRQS
jgi:predicted alpha/beta-fold hydrolase